MADGQTNIARKAATYAAISLPTGSVNLGGGWFRDPAGNLHKAPEIIEAFAEHCFERVQHQGDFTRITLRGFHHDRGSVFIALLDGWLPEGAEWRHDGKIYRLSTVRREPGMAPHWRRAEAA